MKEGNWEENVEKDNFCMIFPFSTLKCELQKGDKEDQAAKLHQHVHGYEYDMGTDMEVPQFLKNKGTTRREYDN